MEQFHLCDSQFPSAVSGAKPLPSPSQTPNSSSRSPFPLPGGAEDLPPRRQHPEKLLQVAEEHQREGRLSPPAPRRRCAAHQVWGPGMALRGLWHLKSHLGRQGNISLGAVGISLSPPGHLRDVMWSLGIFPGGWSCCGRVGIK